MSHGSLFGTIAYVSRVVHGSLVECTVCLVRKQLKVLQLIVIWYILSLDTDRRVGKIGNINY